MTFLAQLQEYNLSGTTWTFSHRVRSADGVLDQGFTTSVANLNLTSEVTIKADIAAELRAPVKAAYDAQSGGPPIIVLPTDFRFIP